MDTGELSNPDKTSFHNVLPFPKQTSREGCSMCLQLCQGRRLFQPLHEVRMLKASDKCSAWGNETLIQVVNELRHSLLKQRAS
jgi:hypothetical protein